jgi:hypothetical protein
MKKPTEMQFKWHWCTACNCACILGPKCGNNTCNGGYGEVDGKKCDICPLSYQFDQFAWNNKVHPTKASLTKKKKSIKKDK